MRRMTKTISRYVSFAALFLFLQCDSTAPIESTRPEKGIVVDGNIPDWDGLIKYGPSDKFGVGIANDDSSLYVCLITQDPAAIRQVVQYGLTMFMQPLKPKRNRLGVRFPMGMENSGIDMRQFKEARGDTEAMRKLIEESFCTLEIIGPGKQDSVPMKTAVTETFGIKLKAVASLDKFVYEAKIPLHADSTKPYAAQASADSMITIVLESTAPQPVDAKEEAGNGEYGGGGGMRAGGAGFGGGHGGGGRHGGMGEGPGPAGMHGGSHEPPEPFSATLHVKLAAAGDKQKK